MIARRIAYPLAAAGLLLPLWVAADVATTHPYAGVTHIVRTETSPRPITMHVVEIDLATPGLRFAVTPHAGPLDTYKQTTLDFLSAQGAQIAINAHFFEPWPPPGPDPGTADLVGFAASGGDTYSHFEDSPPKSYAIQANAPGLNLDATNQASIVHRDFSDPTGFTVAEPVTVWNAVAGNEQMITDGVDTVPNDSWNRDSYSARTAIGLSTDRRTLFFFTVDKAGTSQGLSVYEAAEFLRAPPYEVYEALAMDGGGSTTLAMEDPLTHLDAIVNVPSGTPRAVGSNLAVFALPASTGVGGSPAVADGAAALGPVYPNPLRAAATAELTLPRAERIEARVLDVTGRLVKVLASGAASSGAHTLGWDGTDDTGTQAPPGCYLLTVAHEDGVLFRKIALVR